MPSSMGHSLPNTEADFWAKVDQSAGPNACWPWLLSKDRQGRGRFSFNGKMRYAHHIIYFFEHGRWPKQASVLACPQLRCCCNTRHIHERGFRESKMRKRMRATSRTHDRLTNFNVLLAHTYPQLSTLVSLLGDNLTSFMNAHEGSAFMIPSRAELREMARAIDCSTTLKDLKPTQAAIARKKLQRQYQCDEVAISGYVEMGNGLMKPLQESQRRTPNKANSA